MSSCASTVCASAASGSDAQSAIAIQSALRARAPATRAGLRDGAFIAPAGEPCHRSSLASRVLNRVRVDDAAREDASPFDEARETVRKMPILPSARLAGDTRARVSNRRTRTRDARRETREGERKNRRNRTVQPVCGYDGPLSPSFLAKNLDFFTVGRQASVKEARETTPTCSETLHLPGYSRVSPGGEHARLAMSSHVASPRRCRPRTPPARARTAPPPAGTGRERSRETRRFFFPD